jgi:Animal haem peroxidase
MAGHTTHQPHGSGIRGLNSLKNIDNKNELAGKFGRMFKGLPPTNFPEDDLFKLGDAMTGIDGPKDGKDSEESDFGSAYTYFGQFIDHDLTFDPSSFQEQKSDPDGITDFRTPRFDLDNLYGRGPGDQPFLYDGLKFIQGDKLFTVARNPNARDLPRSPAASDGTRRAIIGDPRNDENVIVSQLQGMMQRFHNRMVDIMVATNPKVGFSEVNLEVRRHYQWAVVHDFLPKIVHGDVLDAISPAIADATKSFKGHPPHLKFYKFSAPIMPVEFSVAAYRLGHSMVRPGYRVNEFTSPLLIFDAQNPTNGLNAFGDFPKSWGIDWQRFIDLGLRTGHETKTDRVQLAYKIDTSIVLPLGNLPKSVAGDEAIADPHKFNLGFRNLLRGQILLLPSGQDVAKKMGVDPLPDKKIILHAANDKTKETDGEKGAKAPTIVDISRSFKRKCPLWVYILAESRRNFYLNGRACLGEVGGRIVGEVFLALLKQDPDSIVNNPQWKPMQGSMLSFGLADILKTALAD